VVGATSSEGFLVNWGIDKFRLVHLDKWFLVVEVLLWVVWERSLRL